MKKFYVLMVLAVALVLGACGSDKEKSSEHGSVNDGENVNEYGAIDHGIDDKKVGFNMFGGTVEEATGVPATEKEIILEVFDVYIDTFNNKDIDGYLETLSGNYDKEAERDEMVKVLDANDVTREASDVTIVKYSENEAQVFAKLQTKIKQHSTGLETNPSGRQVTVLEKEQGKWKIGKIHFIGDDPNK